MAKTTISLNNIWKEVIGEENILKIRKNKESFELLHRTLELLTKEIMIQAVKYAKDSGRAVVNKEDMENALKLVLGLKGDKDEL